MKTAGDSSVLFDIVKGAPGAAAAQAALEAALAQGGLCVCAVVVAELGRYFANE
jgi:predicted nucleic acid-binding protein